MVKFVTPSLLTFLLLSICGSESKIDSYRYTDILNIGYDILRSSAKENDVFTAIDDLWRSVLSDYPSYISNELNSDVRSIVLDSRASRMECATGAIQNGTSAKCTSEEINHAQQVLSVEQKIDEFNKHIKNIDAMYRAVFTTQHTDFSKPFVLTDGLYNFINSLCSQESTCIFYQIAGKYFLGDQARFIRSPLAVNGEVYYVYFVIIFHFLKGYAAEIYRHNSSSTDSAKIRELSRAKFIMHTHTVGQLALDAIKDAPRYIVREEPSATSLDPPYIELSWFVSRVIVNEADLSPHGSCTVGCEPHKDFFHFPSSTLGSGPRDSCAGTLSHCWPQPTGDVYPAIRQFRRYEGIKLKDGRSYGDIEKVNVSTALNSDYVYRVNLHWSRPCAICTCLCDDYDNPDTIRTFSLKEVTSNIQNNMVITGLKLVEMNGIIYIRIRESTLRDLGRVNASKWVRIDTIDKKTAPLRDYFELRFKDRNFLNLDTISIQDEHVQEHILNNDVHYIFFPHRTYVLTGVKFGLRLGVLCFGIRLSAWDPDTRTISLRKWNDWIFNDNVIDRKRIKVENADVPTKTTDFQEVMEGSNYVTFEPSDNVKDFAQTTIPFLDIRPVITSPPMPLSGAGLFYKGKQGYGGIVGLKLVTIDYSDLIVTEVK